MLRADFMPRSNDAPFQEAKRRFNPIGVNIAMRVFLGMVNRLVLVLRGVFQHKRINHGFIGHNDFNVPADIRIYDVAHRLGLRILSSDQPQIPVALANPNDNLFLALLTPSARLPINVGFVHFYRAAQGLWRNLLHRGADAVREVPRRLVADSDGALNLARRHSRFCFAEQRDGDKPLPKGQVRIVEYRAGSHAELVMA